MADVVVTVAEIRRETDDAVTLRLDLGGAAFPYRPGQYIEIDPHQFPELAGEIATLEAAKGMPESPRGFSLSSDALEPGFLEISIKEDRKGAYPPLLTPFLVRRVKAGQKLALTGPAGRYGLPESPPAVAGFLHLCAGSGVAPNRGMIRHALARGWPQRHLLVLQNRTAADVFFAAEWPALLERHADRLRVRHVLSVTSGEHVSVELLRGEMKGWLDGAADLALVCGPNRPRESVGPDGAKTKQPGFCEQWCGHPRRKLPGLLDQLGFTPDRILTEMW